MSLRSVLFVLALALLLAACSTPPDQLVIGAVSKHIGAFPLQFSIDTGLLDAEQYKLRYYSSEGKLAVALAEGRVDAAALPFTQFVGTDAPVKLYSSMMRNGGGVVVRGGSLESTRGQRVGVYADYLVPLLAVMLSDSQHLDWEIAQYSDREALTMAWSSGEIAAVGDAAPYIYGYAGEDAEIVWFSQTFPGYPACDLFVNEKALSAKQELLATAEEAAQTAASLINAYPNQAIDRFMMAYPFKREMIRQTLTQAWYYPTDDDGAQAFRKRAAAMLGF